MRWGQGGGGVKRRQRETPSNPLWQDGASVGAGRGRGSEGGRVSQLFSRRSETSVRHGGCDLCRLREATFGRPLGLRHPARRLESQDLGRELGLDVRPSL